MEKGSRWSADVASGETWEESKIRVEEEEEAKMELEDSEETKRGIVSKMLLDLLKLNGSCQIAERQLQEIIGRDTSCLLCLTEFHNSVEHVNACRNFFEKLEILKRKQRYLEDSLKAIGERLSDAANEGKTRGHRKTRTFQTCDNGKAILRTSHLMYIRSLRSEGIQKKQCPVCAKEICNMGDFLARLDRSAQNASKTGFPHHIM